VRSRDIIFRYVTASTASYSLVGIEMYGTRQFPAFYSHFQVTSGQMTSLPDHFPSPEIM